MYTLNGIFTKPVVKTKKKHFDFIFMFQLP